MNNNIVSQVSEPPKTKIKLKKKKTKKNRSPIRNDAPRTIWSASDKEIPTEQPGQQIEN